VETVCDNESGAAFGLCNAYCEAMDCDSPFHRASDKACANVRRNFEKKTGRPMPCEATCPCGDLIPLFGDVVSGEATVVACFLDDNAVFVITDAREFAMVLTGPPASCNANFEAPEVELTSTERQVCRVQLRDAAEAQGVPCVPPE
jgi:hypothetical protein